MKTARVDSLPPPKIVKRNGKTKHMCPLCSTELDTQTGFVELPDDDHLILCEYSCSECGYEYIES